MSNPSSFYTLSLAGLLLLSVVGCSTTSATTFAPAQVTDPTLVEEVQPPTLPIEPVDEPLPVLGGQVVVQQNLRAAAAASSQVQLRLLLVSPTHDNPGLEALEALCDQVGRLATA